MVLEVGKLLFGLLKPLRQPRAMISVENRLFNVAPLCLAHVNIVPSRGAGSRTGVPVTTDLCMTRGEPYCLAGGGEVLTLSRSSCGGRLRTLSGTRVGVATTLARVTASPALNRHLVDVLRAAFEKAGWLAADVEESCRSRLQAIGFSSPYHGDPWVFCVPISFQPGHVSEVRIQGRRATARTALGMFIGRLRGPGFVIGTASRVLVVPPGAANVWERPVATLSSYSLAPSQLRDLWFPSIEFRLGADVLAMKWRVPYSVLNTALAMLVYGVLVFGLAATGSDAYSSWLQSFTNSRLAPREQLFRALEDYAIASMRLRYEAG
jgi:hypothetical protein